MRHLPALLLRITHRIALPILHSVQSIRLVIVAEGFHPFPFRTRKLSPPAPMVLPIGGRVGRRQAFFCRLEHHHGVPIDMKRQTTTVPGAYHRVHRTRGTRRVRYPCDFFGFLFRGFFGFVGFCSWVSAAIGSCGTGRCAVVMLPGRTGSG